jgi:hypothetical protein
VPARRPLSDGYLEEAIPRLEQRLKGIREVETEIRRRQTYREVKAETEKLAEQVARDYPVLVHKLVSLLEKIQENEYRVKAVNANPPGIALATAETYKQDMEKFPALQSADEIARGCLDFETAHHKKSGMTLNPRIPRLTTSVRLPKTVADYGGGYAWPSDVPRRYIT